MPDSPALATAGPAPPVESAAQQQARLRRERRAAKLQAGESRLQSITALQGGTHRDVKKDLPAKPSPTSSGTATADPAEVDISKHHYVPQAQPRLPSPFAFDGNTTPQPIPAGLSNQNQDPIMQMMQQMLAGGAPGSNHDGVPNPGDLPPGLANLFPAIQGGSAPESSPEQSSAWVWRLVHSLFSLILAVYIVFGTSFTGSSLLRNREAGDEDGDWHRSDLSPDPFARFFYLFATFQVVLQTSRYYIERGQLQGSGMLSTVAQLLPEPYAGYARVIGRYSVIYGTVVSDAMVVVFVLGVASWWKGGV